MPLSTGHLSFSSSWKLIICAKTRTIRGTFVGWWRTQSRSHKWLRETKSSLVISVISTRLLELPRPLVSVVRPDRLVARTFEVHMEEKGRCTRDQPLHGLWDPRTFNLPRDTANVAPFVTIDRVDWRFWSVSTIHLLSIITRGRTCRRLPRWWAQSPATATPL